MGKLSVQSAMLMSFLVVSLCCAASVRVVSAASLADQCDNEVQKVTTCLNFATGKAATPAKECCTAVSEMRESKPVCLCYIIQLANNGSQTVKSLGLQVSRLVQLPSSCKLANSSVSDCPKLLNIPPTSPDYAVFTNNSSSTTTTPSTPSGSSSTPSAASGGGRRRPNFTGPMALVIMATFFSAFPAGFASTSLLQRM